MAQRYDSLSEKLITFIQNQKIYFVGTAIAEGRVNISPKGMNSLRVLNNNRVIWLNVTGSGNETAAHVQENPRMTIMFTALEGSPMILRLYGQARAIHRLDPEWSELYAHFEPEPGARQIYDLSIDLVQTSCGMAVPLYDYKEDRQQLSVWAQNKGEEGIQQYWEEKNQLSIDGQPTHIVSKNLSSPD
ncbi:pyridoxamine 5'-phosphate oxidase family protein [Marinobacter alexandrii]|uniref:pyridoxamine 5'-phosphate oxidase family protein n=1 Tax=Marinobacter alexandrii TaxID=2570351 RepID=UPI00329A5753